MNAFQIALQIISFIRENQALLKALVLDIEGLIPNTPGNTKATAVRTAIGIFMGIEAQIETAWPMVAPIFNIFIGDVKKPVVP